MPGVVGTAGPWVGGTSSEDKFCARSSKEDMVPIGAKYGGLADTVSLFVPTDADPAPFGEALRDARAAA